MATLYRNFLAGTITDNPLLIGATTINSAGFANLPVVAGPDIMWLVLDPDAGAGAPELVKVTAHTASATAITVVRAQQSTTARQHNNGTTWRIVATQTDFEEFLKTVVTANIVDGNVTLAKLAANSVDASKIVDASVGNAELANDAVTQAKMANDSVGTAELINLNVTTGKLAASAVDSTKLAANAVRAANLSAGIWTRAAPLSIPGSSSTAITFDTQVQDFDSWLDDGVTWPCPTSGTYMITAEVDWASNPSGTANINVNGFTAASAVNNGYYDTTNRIMRVWAVMPLTAGDTIQIVAVNGTGGAINVTAKMTLFRIA